MFCPNCGSKVNDGSKFCSSCGAKLNDIQGVTPKVEESVQPVVQQPVEQVVKQPFVNSTPPVQQPYVQPPVQSGLKGWQKGIIIGLLALVLLLLIILGVTTLSGGGSSVFSKNKKYDSRTIMIYLVGSNLESEVFSATADMSQVDPTQIDLSNTNILIYTGGTSFWRNYVRNDENAIYKLTANGFEKIESYQKAKKK